MNSICTLMNDTWDDGIYSNGIDAEMPLNM